MWQIYKTEVARSIPFDNSTNGFTSTDVQGAIEELGLSASPAFTWGRSGTTSAGTWLLNDSVPSNKAGRTTVLGAMKIVKIFSATEDLNTYTLDLYHHLGNEVSSTYLTTLTVTASRFGNSGTVSVSIPANVQVAVKLNTGSAKNIVVGIIAQGDI